MGKEVQRLNNLSHGTHTYESIPGSTVSIAILAWSVARYSAAEQTSKQYWKQALELPPNMCQQWFAEICLTMQLNNDCKGTAAAELEQQWIQTIQQA